MASKEVLEQICEFCDSDYCTIRAILSAINQPITPCQHISECHDYCENIIYLLKKGVGDRVLLQFKCVEELKWIKSQELKRELSWDEAGMMWVEEGYAEKFADIYNKGIRDIYFFFKQGTVPKRQNNVHLDHAFDLADSSNYDKPKAYSGNKLVTA